jgi:hypothetical protein
MKTRLLDQTLVQAPYVHQVRCGTRQQLRVLALLLDG